MPMCLHVKYSPVCDSDPELYRRYLSTLDLVASCGQRNAVFSDEFCSSRFAHPMGYATTVVDEFEDVVNRGREHAHARPIVESLCDRSIGDISANFTGNAGCTRCNRVDGENGHDNKDNGCIDDNGKITQCDGARNVGNVNAKSTDDCQLNVGIDSVGSVPGAFGRVDYYKKGPNYERNKAQREQQKRRKQRKKGLKVDCGSLGVERESENIQKPVDCGDSAPASGGRSGFWNSCSADVRQSLIDSKARMHIADNNRRAEEAERRVNQLQSPEQILRDAMRMVNFANEQAKKQNDNKIYGWAKTVAESYAETIARSASTSVESFDNYIQSNSSITAVSLDVHNEVLKERDDLQKINADNQKEKEVLVRRISELERSVERNIGKKYVSVLASGEKTTERDDGSDRFSGLLPRSSYASVQEHSMAVRREKLRAAKGTGEKFGFERGFAHY